MKWMKSHSGTPHAQHSDACIVFHVSAYACGAGVSQTGGLSRPCLRGIFVSVASSVP